MRATRPKVALVLEMLAETPERIARACDGVDDRHLVERPDPDTWSVLENLAHLRACADVWGKSIRSMLEVDGATQPHLSPRTYMKTTNYTALGFAESLAAFTRQREALLATLRDLEFADWSRSATIEGRIHTVFTQARRMALHERDHCEQIEETLGRQAT